MSSVGCLDRGSFYWLTRLDDHRNLCLIKLAQLNLEACDGVSGSVSPAVFPLTILLENLERTGSRWSDGTSLPSPGPWHGVYWIMTGMELEEKLES